MSNAGFTIDYGWAAPPILEQLTNQGHKPLIRTGVFEELRESLMLLSVNGLVSALEKQKIARRLTNLIAKNTKPIVMKEKK